MKQLTLPLAGMYVAFGVVVGIFSGLFGVGGGIIMIPFLVLISGVTQQTAQGIALGVMVPTALANVARYAKAGNFDLWIALLLAAGAVPAGYFFGADFAQRLPQNTLKGLFSLMIVAIAVRMMPVTGPRSVHSLGLLLGVMLVAIGIKMMFTK